MLRTPLVRALLIGAAICILVGTSPAHAATRTWDGGTGVGDGSNWNTPANWGGDIAPVPGADDLVFAGATDTATNNNFTAGSQFNGITFDVGASSFTAGGNSMVLGGNVVNNSSNAQSLSLPIVLGSLSATAISGASQFTTNVGAGNLTVSGLSRTALSGQAAIFLPLGGTINTSLTNDTSGILGAWATTGSAANLQTDWATRNGSGNVIAYTGYTDITGALGNCHQRDGELPMERRHGKRDDGGGRHDRHQHADVHGYRSADGDRGLGQHVARWPGRWHLQDG